MDSGLRNSQVKILFFAKARELAGVKESETTLPANIHYQLLLNTIVEKFGLESIRDTVILSVNEQYVASDVLLNLSDRDEIAVIPPLSGVIIFISKFDPLVSLSQVEMDESKDVVKLQLEPLSIGQVVELVVSPNCGAISTFIGTTRDNFEKKKVITLEYEAYEPMALKELRIVCSKIRSQWDVERIAIYHRLGLVPVAEASVIIAISSPHRQESLEATRFAIEALKSTVPIWKKEIYDTKESQWKENRECSWSTSQHETFTTDAKFATVNDSPSFEKQKVSSADKTQVSNQIQAIEKKESSDVVIDPNLVQIRASAEELNRRIEAFIARKREQVNIVNVQEFCCHRARVDTGEESSCARVDAILIRRKDSKSHVKVHRVLNPWGPQMVDPASLQKTSKNHSNQSSPGNYPPALEERFATNEGHIGIKGPVPKDVYQRLKRIEDKILYLESLSPEYKNFWGAQEDESFKSSYKPVRKRTFSTAELDTKLHELENKYAKKAN